MLQPLCTWATVWSSDRRLGPLVSERGRKKVIDFIEKGINEGAKLVLDGRKNKR